MNRLLLLGLASLALLLPVGSASALMIAPPSIPARVAAADAVIVGKVTALADKLVPAEVAKGDSRQMQIATVQVSDGVFGTKRKIVQIGFFPPPPPPPMGNLIGRPIRRFPTVQLTVGQEALIYLVRHPTKKDVYLAQNYYDVVNKKDNPNFARELDEARKAAGLLNDPKVGLTARNAELRLLTAGLLINRYRTQRPGSTKTAPVSAEESKQILSALAEADWGPQRGGRDWMMTPASLFFRLNLGPKDGWTPPADANRIPEAAKKWLVDNAGKYRLERFVWPGSDEVSPEPDK